MCNLVLRKSVASHFSMGEGYNCHRLNCDYSLGGVMGSVLMCIFNGQYSKHNILHNLF